MITQEKRMKRGHETPNILHPENLQGRKLPAKELFAVEFFDYTDTFLCMA